MYYEIGEMISLKVWKKSVMGLFLGFC